VWAAVRDIAGHVDWMEDAVAIRFTSPARKGVGTTFDCDTRVGPLRLTDRMEVTEWREGKAMGIRHVGVVTGTGRFELRRTGPRATRFSWTEDLRFPWWLGGPLAALVGRPVLRRVWRRNLQNLRRQIEGWTQSAS
jgi:hypothetical protein